MDRCTGPLFLTFLLFLPGALHAEVLKLTSGQSVQCKIIKQQKDSVLVDAGVGMPVTYFRDEIKEIDPDPAPGAVNPQAVAARADALEGKAVEMIDAGQMDQGLQLIRQAMAMDPTAQRHMNYGSILFGNGVSAFKSGNQEQGKAILRLAEAELKKAIAGYDKRRDPSFIGQAYFLLGEMYANAFADAPQARAYYQKSVRIAGNDSAKAALEKLGQNSQNP